MAELINELMNGKGVCTPGLLKSVSLHLKKYIYLFELKKKSNLNHKKTLKIYILRNTEC